MDISLVREFSPQTVDKVERMLDLLDELGQHPCLRGKLALHGGTAINLFLLDVPRLSVDIDISYVGALAREEMLFERPVIERSIEEVAKSQGYQLAGGKGGHAGRSFRLAYRSPWGADSVKIDCIFLNRSPLLPINSMSTGLRSGLKVPMFAGEELVGGKVKAFFDRVKVRDLYDIVNLGRVVERMPEDEEALAHVVMLFYASLSASFPHGFKDRPQRFKELNDEFEEQLLPMLRKGRELPFLDGLVSGAHEFIERYVLPRNEREREFLARFKVGDYAPALLFDDDAMTGAALASPEAQWKLANLKRMRR